MGERKQLCLVRGRANANGIRVPGPPELNLKAAVSHTRHHFTKRRPLYSVREVCHMFYPLIRLVNKSNYI